MTPVFSRHPRNPIVRPGRYGWRKAVVFNPGVVLHGDRFLMFERAAGSLRPFQCAIGMLQSTDGVHFDHASDEPVFTPEMAGSGHGSVQDPRVVEIEGTFYMSFAFRPFAWNSSPTGIGVPDSWQAEYPEYDGDERKNQTRSGVAASADGLRWKLAGWVNEEGTDDRNAILFPEKIGGRFAALRRPSGFVGTDTQHGEEPPCICISYSEDLRTWTEPRAVMQPAFDWEDNRIGGSTPPIRTEYGWLLLYHGVQNLNSATRRVAYRLGAALLDLNDPARVIARCPHFLMEPETYYEKFGLYIPNVIFPTGAVVREELLYIYYGVCDTAIALATVPLRELVDYVRQYGR